MQDRYESIRQSVKNYGPDLTTEDKCAIIDWLMDKMCLVSGADVNEVVLDYYRGDEESADLVMKDGAMVTESIITKRRDVYEFRISVDR